MDKKRIYHIVEWTIAIAGCAFLIWKLAAYDDYASLGESLRAMGWKQWSALALCLLLMPVNMMLEAWRWHSLMNESGERLSFREAHRQVYYSKLAGLITPWRLGEYPARALLLESASQESRVESQKTWARVLSMGAVGSATMTAAIIACGAIAMTANWKSYIVDWKLSYLFVVAALLVLLALALYFSPRLLKRWAAVSHRLVMISLGQSFIRLLCWCVQLLLVLYALGAISLQPSAISLSFIYYLLVTITPNVPIAEVGVRGSWAIFVFGSINAALAGVLLWAVNTLLPCLIWPFLRKKAK